MVAENPRRKVGMLAQSSVTVVRKPDAFLRYTPHEAGPESYCTIFRDKPYDT